MDRKTIIEKTENFKISLKHFLKYGKFKCLFSVFIFFYAVFGFYVFLTFNFTSVSFIPANYTEASVASVLGESESLPEKILIPAIDLEAEIINPVGDDINTLERALKSGIIRHPLSGTSGRGNILLLGHSSRLRNVRNPAYKALNSLEMVQAGDQIIMESGGEKVFYTVSTVSKTLSVETMINFKTEKPAITISTCNFLGKEEERIVVTAILSEV